MLENLQFGVNLDTAKDGFGGDDFGFLMDASVTPTITVKKGSAELFQIGGSGGGIQATATIYYVSLIQTKM